MKRSHSFSCLVAVLAVSLGCTVKPAPNSGAGTGTPGPTSTTPTPAMAPPPAPMTCDDFCAKVNTVPGCATDPAQVPACAELCKQLQAGACKSKEEAAILCVAGADLKCKGNQADLGACEAQTKDANDCFKTLPPTK